MNCPDPRSPRPTRAGRRAIVPVLGTVLALAFAGAGLLWSAAAPTPAHAQLDVESDLRQQKAYWQERYRELLTEAARLEENARRARENYARAQRRNYPRGGARQRYIVEAEQAEAQLAKLREEIDEFQSEARRQGAYPGWLYEVEDEDIQPPQPAAADAVDPEDAGRNPLYLDDEDDEESDAGRNPLYVDDEQDD